jgi:hypothetical protein
MCLQSKLIGELKVVHGEGCPGISQYFSTLGCRDGKLENVSLNLSDKRGSERPRMAYGKTMNSDRCETLGKLRARLHRVRTRTDRPLLQHDNGPQHKASELQIFHALVSPSSIPHHIVLTWRRPGFFRFPG